MPFLRIRFITLVTNLFILPLILFAAFSLIVSSQVFAAAKLPEKPIHSRMLVKFASGVDKKAVAERRQAKIISEIPQIGVTVLDVEGSEDEATKKLSQEKIEYIEPDSVATTLSTDFLYGSQWALPKILWDKLAITLDAFNPPVPSVEIAIVDTGVDYNHPDLTGKVDTANDWDFVNNDNDAMDDNLHGTHVAGIAAANTNNGVGIAGVSINTAKILPVKVLNQNGSGYYSWVAAGIIYAADHGAKVINLSLGGSSGSSTLEDAVNHAWNKGAVVVAAAGNSNNPSKTYPGAYQNAMAVWASDQNDNKASFSSYGSWVDIGAPGVNILSTIPWSKDTKDGLQDGYYLGSGTSMATPHVSGLAGFLFSQHTDWSATAVRTKIESTADPVGGRLFTRGNLGKGRINVFKALTQ